MQHVVQLHRLPHLHSQQKLHIHWYPDKFFRHRLVHNLQGMCIGIHRMHSDNVGILKFLPHTRQYQRILLVGHGGGRLRKVWQELQTQLQIDKFPLQLDLQLPRFLRCIASFQVYFRIHTGIVFWYQDVRIRWCLQVEKSKHCEENWIRVIRCNPKIYLKTGGRCLEPRLPFLVCRIEIVEKR